MSVSRAAQPCTGHRSRESERERREIRSLCALGAGLGIDWIRTGWYGSSMNTHILERPQSGRARSKLLEAAFSIIRQKGYAATTVDDLCAKAGVTKRVRRR